MNINEKLVLHFNDWNDRKITSELQKNYNEGLIIVATYGGYITPKDLYEDANDWTHCYGYRDSYVIGNAIIPKWKEIPTIEWNGDFCPFSDNPYILYERTTFEHGYEKFRIKPAQSIDWRKKGLDGVRRFIPLKIHLTDKIRFEFKVAKIHKDIQKNSRKRMDLLLEAKTNDDINKIYQSSLKELEESFKIDVPNIL